MRGVDGVSTSRPAAQRRRFRWATTQKQEQLQNHLMRSPKFGGARRTASPCVYFTMAITEILSEIPAGGEMIRTGSLFRRQPSGATFKNPMSAMAAKRHLDTFFLVKKVSAARIVRYDLDFCYWKRKNLLVSFRLTASYKKCSTTFLSCLVQDQKQQIGPFRQKATYFFACAKK